VVFALYELLDNPVTLAGNISSGRSGTPQLPLQWKTTLGDPLKNY